MKRFYLSRAEPSHRWSCHLSDRFSQVFVVVCCCYFIAVSFTVLEPQSVVYGSCIHHVTKLLSVATRHELQDQPLGLHINIKQNECSAENNKMTVPLAILLQMGHTVIVCRICTTSLFATLKVIMS